MFTIEKGIALPETKRVEFPLTQMEVGDSFMLTNKNQRSTLTKHLQDFNKIHPDRKFVTKTVAGGVRVWRNK